MTETFEVTATVSAEVTKQRPDKTQSAKPRRSRKRTPREAGPESEASHLKSAPAHPKQGERNKRLGKRGEDAAALFLQRRGYTILERNWSCMAGEADIIATDGESLIFVEVKTRSNINKGFPEEAVGTKKRQRYEKIALAYISQYDGEDMGLRFDVISIVVVKPTRAVIRHHINAFSIL